MKNLLNCHCIGLHSFPIEFDQNNELYKRVFYANHNHELWKPIQIAIHPHHVDIKITVLCGELSNVIYDICEGTEGETFNKFLWNSHILNGKGGFQSLGQQNLKQISYTSYKSGETITMKACEMHTVQVKRGEVCAWIIEESKPTCDYFPVNYSKQDLQKWTPEGLYIECNDETKQKYLSGLI